MLIALTFPAPAHAMWQFEPTSATDLIERGGLVVEVPRPLELDERRPEARSQIGVRLASAPTADVVVTATHLEGQLVLTNTRVRFTPNSWNVTQYVHVAAVDDAVAEPDPHRARITIVREDLERRAGQRELVQLDALISDDDVPSIRVESGAGWPTTPDVPVIEERGGQMSARFTLGTAPTRDIVVTPRVEPAGQLTITPAQITWSAGQRLEPVDVTIRSVDDARAETSPHRVRVNWVIRTHDPSYLSMELPATIMDIRDDDSAGLEITPSENRVELSEGGAGATLRIRLTSEPAHPVFVSVAPDEQLLTGTITRTLRFDSSTWSTPQLVELSARDDDIVEPSPHAGRVQLRVTSMDAAYSALRLPDVVAQINDNDVPGVELEGPGQIEITEGGGAALVRLRLSARPLAPVFIALDADAQLASDPATLEMRPEAWSTWHEIRIAAAQNDVLDGDRSITLGIGLASGDTAFAARAATNLPRVDVRVRDDEQPGLVMNAVPVAVAEGGAPSSYTVRLAARPTAQVHVDLQPDTQVQVTPSTITFTADDWNVPQQVNVSAVQDDRAESPIHHGVIEHSVRTTAHGWSELRGRTVDVAITDDDAAAILFEQTGTDTRVVEGGPGDEIRFSLLSRPASPVTIQLRSSDGQTEFPRQVTIDPNEWSQPVTVPIAAAEDEDDEGEHQSLIEFTVRSTDRSYDRQQIAALTVVVVDDVASHSETLEEDDAEADDGAFPTIPIPPVDAATLAISRPPVDRTSARQEHRARTRTEPTATRRLVAAGDARRAGASEPNAMSRVGWSERSSRETSEAGRASLGRWIQRRARIAGVISGLLLLSGVGVTWIRMKDPMFGLLRR